MTDERWSGICLSASLGLAQLGIPESWGMVELEMGLLLAQGNFFHQI